MHRNHDINASERKGKLGYLTHNRTDSRTRGRFERHKYNNQIPCGTLQLSWRTNFVFVSILDIQSMTH